MKWNKAFWPLKGIEATNQQINHHFRFPLTMEDI